MSVLAGVKVLEVEGIGPGPFCAMLLADLGAEVVLVQRTRSTGDISDLGGAAIQHRGKRSVALDLKSPQGVQVALQLAGQADCLVEGMRPGVMERLGLGPEACRARNPRLVYGRMTGWGQTGPLAHAAGHDLNYLGLSGALWYASPAGTPPYTPPTVVGDVAGGALYLAIGLLAGILNARATGRGQVIDAAIVDGAAHMLNLLFALRASGRLAIERGASIIDGSHWSSTYRCADGRFVAVQSLEPGFYAVLLERLGLAADPDFARQYDPGSWPQARQRFAELFATRTRDEWCVLLEGSDACFAPVLDPEEAARHPHNVARGVFSTRDAMLQANPAPRFSNSPPPQARPVPLRGEHTREVLRQTGIDEAQVRDLIASGAVACAK
ncbi:MAG: CoA transferase [Betaproteobacteria bacterium]|nr:CoA transferase [Betaproteobacteria bacterium]